MKIITKLPKVYYEYLGHVYHCGRIEIIEGYKGMKKYELMPHIDKNCSIWDQELLFKQYPKFEPFFASYGMVIVKGQTQEECINGIIEKYSNEIYVPFAKRNCYVGIWPFGYKGIEILVFIQSEENIMKKEKIIMLY